MAIKTVKRQYYTPSMGIIAAADKPATPAVGVVVGPYRKDDGVWYEMRSDGVEYPIVDPIDCVYPADNAVSVAGKINCYASAAVIGAAPAVVTGKAYSTFDLSLGTLTSYIAKADGSAWVNVTQPILDGAWASRGSISTAVLPTAATATIRPNEALKNYNTFLASAQITIPGIQGDDTLDVGDLLVLIDEANPTLAASWLGVQRNVTDRIPLIREKVTITTVAADTATNVPFVTPYSNIVNATVWLNNVQITDSVIVLISGANLQVQSSDAMANVVVEIIGTL